MATINIDDAIKELATLIARPRSGEEIVIADGTGNAVRLAPVGQGVANRTSYRGRGLLKGKARVSDEDLFGPLPDDETARWLLFSPLAGRRWPEGPDEGPP